MSTTVRSNCQLVVKPTTPHGRNHTISNPKRHKPTITLIFEGVGNESRALYIYIYIYNKINLKFDIYTIWEERLYMLKILENVIELLALGQS